METVSLPDLMQSILEYHPPDYLRHQLERHDVHLWQRDTEAEVYEQLDTKLRQLSIEHSPSWLVRQLCNKQGLIAIMRDKFPDAYLGVEFAALDMSALTKSVLEAFGIPCPTQYMGPHRIHSELEHYKRQITPYMRRSGLGQTQRMGRQEPHMLRGLNISCWTYLEELLKQVLGFYAVHFGKIANTIAEELRRAFVEACRVQSKPLGRILEAFREIEFIFEYGESRRQKQERQRRNKQAIDKSEGAQSVVDRTGMENEAVHRQGQEIVRRLREECIDAFGRPSPFSSLQVNEIQKLVRRYRNPYAHETIDRLMRNDPTGKTARQSVTSALNFVDDLISNDIAPRLIFLVAEGNDTYGRRFISYIEEEQLDNREAYDYSINGTMHFYHNTLPFCPFAAYLIIERHDIGVYYEPPVYSYKDVSDSISK
jgi:hypothetical protein